MIDYFPLELLRNLGLQTPKEGESNLSVVAFNILETQAFLALEDPRG